MTVRLLMLVPVLTALGLPLATLRFERWRITPFLLAMITLATTLIGFVLLDLRNGRFLSLLFALSVAFLFVGYVLQKRRVSSDPIAAVEHVPTRALYIFWALIVGLVAYHFVVGGVPLLSEEIDTERFEFTSSGLFGIPGRIFLYGLPFLAFLVTAVHFRGPGSPVRGLWLLTWVVLAIAWVLSGFKSAVLTVVVVAVFALALARREIRLTRAITRPALALVVSGLAFFIFLSFRLAGTQVRSVPDAFVYLLQRPTVIQAEPAYFALNELGDAPRPYLISDSLYFINKYLGIRVVEQPLFTLDQVVSANINSVPLEEGSFIVPVTVGAFAGLEADFGPVGALVAMLVLGWGFGQLLTRAVRSTNPFAAASWCFAAYMTSFYIAIGGLPYVIINGAAVLVFLLFLWLVCRTTAGVIDRSRQTDVAVGLDSST